MKIAYKRYTEVNAIFREWKNQNAPVKIADFPRKPIRKLKNILNFMDK